MAFGLFPVIGKVAFGPGGLSPLVLGAWRLAAGTAILLPVSVAVHGRGALPAKSDLLRFTVAGWLGVALNQALYLEGLARSTPINATLVMCLIPVFTFALAALARQETFGVIQVAGLGIALSGTVALLLGRGFTLGRYGFGNLLMVANTLSYSGYLVASKPLARKYPPLVVIAWSYALSFPFAPWFAWKARVMPEPGHPAVWVGLIYTIIFPTILAYLLNMFALARVPASTTAIYIYVQPLITGLASWVVFRETPTHQMLVAAPALFLGIWLVSRRAPPPPQPGPVPS